MRIELLKRIKYPKQVLIKKIFLSGNGTIVGHTTEVADVVGYNRKYAVLVRGSGFLWMMNLKVLTLVKLGGGGPKVEGAWKDKASDKQ